MIHVYAFATWFSNASLFRETSTQSAMLTILSILVDVLTFVFLVAGIVLFLRVRQRHAEKTPVASVKVSSENKGKRRWRPGIQMPLALAIPTLVFVVILLGNAALPPASTVIITTPTSRPTPRPTPVRPAIAPPNDLMTNGVLTVGTSTIYALQSYIDSTNGKPAGFDIELITSLAAEMGLKIQFVRMDHSELIDSLNNKQVDIVIAAYPVAGGVKKQLQSVPYLAPHDVFLTQKGNPKGVQFKALTDMCATAVGITVGVLQGSPEETAFDSLCAHVPHSSLAVQPFSDVNALLDGVARGIVTGAYLNTPTWDANSQQFASKLTEVGSPMKGTPEGILVRQGDTAMFTSISNAFQLFKKKGYQSLLETWGLDADGV